MADLITSLEKKYFENNINNISFHKFENSNTSSFIKNLFKVENAEIKINSRNKTSFFQSGGDNKNILKKKLNYNRLLDNKYSKNNNSCPILITNDFSKTNNKFFLKNKKSNYEERNKYLNSNFFPNKKIKTFHNDNISEFLLDKRIKILKRPRASESILKLKKNRQKTKYELQFEYRYKKIYERKLPLKDLRCYKSNLFEDSKIPLTYSQYFKNDTFNNSKLISTFKKSRNNNSNLDSFYNDSKEIVQENREEKNYEIIEMNGIKTKVLTKLSKFDTTDKNNKEDFHKIMKHPLIKEYYSYKFMKNLGVDNKIYKNPLEDKDLIQKIRNLIINPNTKQFRNGNIIKNSLGLVKSRSTNILTKNYKLLSEKGYKLLQKNKMNKLKQEAKEKVNYIEKIKEKLNLLMDKNLKVFQEHKDFIELYNK